MVVNLFAGIQLQDSDGDPISIRVEDNLNDPAFEELYITVTDDYDHTAASIVLNVEQVNKLLEYISVWRDSALLTKWQKEDGNG